MKLEDDLQETIKRKFQDMKQFLSYFGYAEIGQAENVFMESVDLFAWSQNLKNDQLKIGIDLGFIFNSHQNSWRIYLMLQHDQESCHLELMLPRLPNPKDPTILCFSGSQDPQELDKSASVAVENLIEVLKGDFAPFLLGQKWEQTYLPMPKEYF